MKSRVGGGKVILYVEVDGAKAKTFENGEMQLRRLLSCDYFLRRRASRLKEAGEMLLRPHVDLGGGR